MKKIYYSLLTLIGLTAIGSAQTNIDFEAGGAGADYGWHVFENDTNPNLEFVANPDNTGANTSATAAMYTTLETGMPWAGCETVDEAFTPFTLTASNCVIKIMVYKTVISDVAIKLKQTDNTELPEIKVSNTVTGEWEELTFDFSGQVPNTANPIKNIVIFPDFPAGAERTYGTVTYFDNITFNAGAVEVPEEPLTGAPAPAFDEDQVISMYSDTYTNIVIENWLTDWSTGSKQDVVIDGNPAMKYLNLGYAGVDIGVANQVNASAMTYFNINVWLPEDNDMVFAIKLVDFGPNGVWNAPGSEGFDDSEAQLSFPDLTPGEWHTLSIPLSDFAAMTSNEHISQILFVNANDGGGSAIAYVDNIYFSNGEAEEPAVPMAAAPTPTLPQEQVISLFSDAYTNSTVDTWHTEWSNSVYEEIMIEGNATKKFSSLDFTGIEAVGPNALNVTDMTHFNIDVWSPNFPVFKIKMVDFGANNEFGGGDDSEHEIVFEAPAQEQWVTYHIPLTDFTGLTSMEHISQLILATSDGTSIVYIDNVYFSTDTAGIEDFTSRRFVMYPNPASNVLTIQGGATIESIQIINMLGQKVLTDVPNAASAEINVSGLQNGVYVVNTTIGGILSSQRFIKE